MEALVLFLASLVASAWVLASLTIAGGWIWLALSRPGRGSRGIP